MKDFQYESHQSKILFGIGARKNIGNEINTLDVENTLVISTPGRSGVLLANEIAELLGPQCIGVYAKAVEHVPHNIAKDGVDYVLDKKVRSLIAVGGGSAIGLAKAIALETSLPIVAIPTTYSGSEMTQIWGITENGVKKTGKNMSVKPKVVIYDPELTTGLPVYISVTSGINALAHCVEALYSNIANPITSLIAEEGIRALSTSLPKIVRNPNDLDARYDALYGSWLAGTALATVGVALHHKLCHTLGGTCNLAHGETNSVVLPYAIAYNAAYAPDAMKAISRALQTEDENIAGVVYDFVNSLGAPVSLASIGFEKENIENVASLATKNPYWNPRPIDEKSISKLLMYALQGERPTSDFVF